MRPSAIVIILSVLSFIATSYASDPRELRPYTPEGARCAFSTVNGSRPVSTIYQRGTDAAEAKGRLYCFDQRHCRCQVRYVDLPAENRELTLHEIVTQYAPEYWTKSTKLELEKAVKSQEHEGEQYLATWPHSETKKPLYARVRVFRVANRAYFVSASFTDEKQPAAEPEAQTFLESFRILAE